MSRRSPLIIAEAGVNHCGNLDRAKAMVGAAAKAGADYVKFQAFQAQDLVTPEARAAAYQTANTGAQKQSALLEGLQLSHDDFSILAKSCRDEGIGFLCTAFDVDFVHELVTMGMDCIKVASGEMTNTPALKHFAALRLPVLLSTGMATEDEVEAAVQTLQSAGAADITLLHCTSLYPAPFETLNLRAIPAMAKRFGLPIGYSDHSLGDHATIAAVALGATAIEKHFTLDRNLPGPDQNASLEPDELQVMIRRLREISKALGSGRKAPAPGEAETAHLVRRSWHASRDLPADTLIGSEDVVLKRPADGLPPSQTPVGRTSMVAIPVNAPIHDADLTKSQT